MQFLIHATGICILVLIGLYFLWKIEALDDIHYHGKKGIGMGAILKGTMMILVLLGVAFLGGSFLAYIQGFTQQILVLGIVGVICLLMAVLCFASRKLYTA